MTTFKNVAWTIIAFCNVLAVCYFLWARLLDDVTVTTQGAHWYGADKVDRTAFRTGETAYLWREFCASRAVNVETARRLSSTDGKIGVSVPASIGVLKAGCSPFAYGLPIPVGLPPGKYVYRVTMRFEVNAVRDDTVVIDSPPIDIIE